jgi:hypothetical protein
MESWITLKILKNPVSHNGRHSLPAVAMREEPHIALDWRSSLEITVRLFDTINENFH